MVFKPEYYQYSSAIANFGKKLFKASEGTKLFFQGEKIFKVTSKSISLSIKKGYHYYLDGLHRDHFEVFDKVGNFVKAINLDGTINAAKTAKGIKDGRNIRNLLK